MSNRKVYEGTDDKLMKGVSAFMASFLPLVGNYKFQSRYLETSLDDMTIQVTMTTLNHMECFIVVFNLDGEIVSAASLSRNTKHLYNDKGYICGEDSSINVVQRPSDIIDKYDDIPSSLYQKAWDENPLNFPEQDLERMYGMIVMCPGG